MKKLSFSIIILFIAITTFAQNDLDALRYSQTFEGGTARSLSMGGAFSSLGMDLSVLSTNPAGLAIARGAQLEFSPSLGYTTTEGLFNNNKRRDSKYNFKLNNFGVSRTFRKSGIEKEWKGISIGLAYNKLRSFNSSSIVEGTNTSSSMLDHFMYNSDGLLPDQLGTREYYAYNAYLTDYDTSNFLYNSPLYQNYGETQRKVLNRQGNIGEYAFSLAANYADIFYFGMTLGIQNIYFKEESSYSELDNTGNYPDFSSFTMREFLTTSGSGYNVKLGVIIRPIDMLRISFAFHSPTFLNLNDTYGLTMDSEFKTPDADGNTGYSLDQKFDKNIGSDYSLTTPAKFLTGASYIFKGIGLISVDYEFTDYGSMKLDANNSDYYDTNDYISQEYTQSHTARVGTEIIAIPGFAFRAGAVYSTPALKEISDYGNSRMAFSAGFGISSSSFYFDLGGIYNMLKWQQYSYSLPEDVGVRAPLEKYSFNDLSIVATMGFKF